jgi:sulfoxide reductase catalytic subunit YedY
VTAVPAGGPKDNPIHYPDDRRLRLWVAPRWLAAFAVAALLPVAAAWLQYAVAGLPNFPPPPSETPAALDGPFGFPGWLRLTHYANFLFMVLLIRSGLSILMDHPRLYWNDHCTPGTEWFRVTPLSVPATGTWTAKEDARYVSPWLGLPGYRHTIGLARHWHFLTALGWLLTGLTAATLLLATGQWRRITPTSLDTVLDAWRVFVYYSTFHMPIEPNGFYRYNSLQQVSYFATMFVMAPLSVLTGVAMSPAVDSRFRWYPRLFGGRQTARSLHFLLAVAFTGFIAVHVTMVGLTGLLRNMNHIVRGTDDFDPSGLLLGVVGIAAVGGGCVVAHHLTWRRPRVVQVAALWALWPIRAFALRRLMPRSRYTRADVSPHFWVNGKMPTSPEWAALAEGGFRDYRLRVSGLVENPVELSLADLARLGRRVQVTMHHCIQGWSGIAEWGGVPVARLVELVRPLPGAKVVVFRSFGEGLYGGEYYDTQPLADTLLPECMLAYEMNGESLPHLYGAPLRLRAENQLGYKMVKWVRAVEFVASEREVGLGYGGKNQDDEYFDIAPYI